MAAIARVDEWDGGDTATAVVMAADEKEERRST